MPFDFQPKQENKSIYDHIIADMSQENRQLFNTIISIMTIALGVILIGSAITGHFLLACWWLFKITIAILLFLVIIGGVRYFFTKTWI